MRLGSGTLSPHRALPTREVVMRALRRTVVVALLAIGILAVPQLASAGFQSGPSKVERATATFDFTDNMDPIGYSARKVPLDNFRPRQGVFNSDLAFWGDTAIQGTYSGFRLIDIDDPDDPEEIVDWEDCASPTNTVGNQGDVIAWGRRGTRPAVADLPLVELADPRTEAELQQPRVTRDPRGRPAAPHAAGRVLRRLADVPRGRDADAPGHPAGHRPRPGGRAHHRRQRPGGARGRRRSSTRRAGRTPRRWCPTSGTTAC